MSPIVDMIYAGLDDETIVEELSDPRTDQVTVSPDLRDTLRKLHLFDATILRDAKSGDILGYTLGLNGDGGQSGHVIVGPNALTITKREE
jgi:hypothetical protein